MDGKIYFNDLKELAQFLSHFISTAKFVVTYDGRQWVLEFTGGY